MGQRLNIYVMEYGVPAYMDQHGIWKQSTALNQSQSLMFFVTQGF